MITTYQIRNVLRIYGNQLKKRSVSAEDLTERMLQYLDSVNISIEVRRRQVLNRMTNRLITKINSGRYSKENG